MIIPAIIPESLKDLKRQLALVPFAEAVQIDVVDGVFAPYRSWPYQGDVRHFDLIHPIVGSKIGIDLMVTDVFPAVTEWLEMKIDRMVVHIESVEVSQLSEIAALCHEAGAQFALAIDNGTPVGILEEQLDTVDFVQVMGIAGIGTQGQPFDERVLERIRYLKSVKPGLIITVDGSVNRDTLPLLQEAGADRFVVGSAIMRQPDPEQAFEELSALL